MIVGLWDRLDEQCRRRLIDIVRASVPTGDNEDEFDETDE
jgi:hypothetical protein